MPGTAHEDRARWRSEAAERRAQPQTAPPERRRGVSRTGFSAVPAQCMTSTACLLPLGPPNESSRRSQYAGSRVSILPPKDPMPASSKRRDLTTTVAQEPRPGRRGAMSFQIEVGASASGGFGTGPAMSTAW